MPRSSKTATVRNQPVAISLRQLPNLPRLHLSTRIGSISLPQSSPVFDHTEKTRVLLSRLSSPFLVRAALPLWWEWMRVQFDMPFISRPGDQAVKVRLRHGVGQEHGGSISHDCVEATIVDAYAVSYIDIHLG